MTEQPDVRQRAFDALLPLAKTVGTAIEMAQERVVAEVTGCPLRAAWTPQQRAGAIGSARFNYVTNLLETMLAALHGVRFVSTPDKKAQNLFLWTVGDRLGLRVKKIPSELDDQAVMTLWEEAPGEADLTACLTWTSEPGTEISQIRFEAGHEEHWVIRLAELLVAHETDVVKPLPRRIPTVTSARPDVAQPVEALRPDEA